MLDIQAVFFHDSAPVHSVDFVTMLRVDDVDTADIDGVYVNGVQSRHMVLEARALAVALPQGTVFGEVQSVRISHESYGGGTRLVSKDSGRITEENTIFSLSGENFSTAVQVLVNGTSQPFTTLSSTRILVPIPKNLAADSIDDVSFDVVVTSTTIQRRTYFKYMMSDQIRTVTGAYKATQQFIKVLLTTPGSDIFDPDGPAGNLQNWHNIQTAGLAKQATAAKLILQLQTTGAQVVALHQSAKNPVPPEERITAIEVLNVGFDKAGTVTVSLKIRTMSAENQLFSLLLNSVKDIMTSTISG